MLKAQTFSVENMMYFCAFPSKKTRHRQQSIQAAKMQDKAKVPSRNHGGSASFGGFTLNEERMADLIRSYMS